MSSYEEAKTTKWKYKPSMVSNPHTSNRPTDSLFTISLIKMQNVVTSNRAYFVLSRSRKQSENSCMFYCFKNDKVIITSRYESSIMHYKRNKHFWNGPQRINSYLNIDGMRDRWVNIIPSALKTSKQPRWGLVNKTLITRCRNRSIEGAAYLILLIQSGSRGGNQQIKLSTKLTFSISSWKLWLIKRWDCGKYGCSPATTKFL